MSEATQAFDGGQQRDLGDQSPIQDASNSPVPLLGDSSAVAASSAADSAKESSIVPASTATNESQSPPPTRSSRAQENDTRLTHAQRLAAARARMKADNNSSSTEARPSTDSTVAPSAQQDLRFDNEHPSQSQLHAGQNPTTREPGAASETPALNLPPVTNSIRLHGMSGRDPRTTSAAPAADIRTIFGGPSSESSPDQVCPPIFRLSQDSRLAVVFTIQALPVSLHYLTKPGGTGTEGEYIHCNGEQCLLCQLGRPANRFALLPIVSLMERRIATLPIRISYDSTSLYAMLQETLDMVADGVLRLVDLRKVGRYDFQVSSRELPPRAWQPHRLIADFTRRFEQGHIELGRIYRQVENSALATLPQIAEEMGYRGITL